MKERLVLPLLLALALVAPAAGAAPVAPVPIAPYSSVDIDRVMPIMADLVVM